MNARVSVAAGLIALATALAGAPPASAGPAPVNDIFVWNSDNPSPVALADLSEPLDGKRLVQVSTGGQHTCALDRAGRAYCWGSDEYGQLGDGDVPRSTGWKPVAVDRSGALSGVRLVEIAAGGDHTCAVSDVGRAYCWGRGDVGQRGDGSRIASAKSPVAVDRSGVLRGRDLEHITAGESHTCALDESGRAYCWGAGGRGRLGEGETRDRSRPVAVDRRGALAGVSLRGISAGSTHTCAVSEAGRGFCWGDGRRGQLGTGEKVTHRRPVAVLRGGPLTGDRLRQVSAGRGFTCSVGNWGDAACWGAGRAGQLGNGSRRSSARPQSVWNVAGAQWRPGSMDSGYSATCAASAKGFGYCWGKGSQGTYLGLVNEQPQRITSDGALKGVAVTDLAVTANEPERGCAVGDDRRAYCWGERGLGYTPQSVSGSGSPQAVFTSGVSDIPEGSVLQQLTASSSHQCVLDSVGKAYCWGANDKGALGLGAGAPLLVARPAAVVSDGALAGVTLDRISAGLFNTCALDTAGKAYCWGGSGDRVGDGTTEINATHPEPVAVDTSGALAGKTLDEISVGYDQSCAIDVVGDAYCWGWGVSGALGTGSTDDAPSPVAVDTSGVLSGVNLTDIATGPFHTCALDKAGKAYCWGDGSWGALGNGSTADSTVPVAVDDSGVLAGKTLVVITANERFTCALDTAGKAYCWGERALGGSASKSPTPVAVDTTGVLSGKDLVQISAGYSHVCARDNAGAVYCWGSGSSGELGDGLSTSSATPVAVDVGGALSGQFVTEVAAGEGGTFALANPA